MTTYCIFDVDDDKVSIYKLYKVAASVCVCVCLSSGFLINVRTYFHETFHGSEGSWADVNGKNIRKISTLNV